MKSLCNKAFHNSFCFKCKKNIFIYHNITLRIDSRISDIFNIYHKILKLKSYVPDSLSYSVNLFATNFNYANDLLVNRQDCFELFVRKYFFNDNFYSRQLTNFVVDYIYLLINLENLFFSLKNKNDFVRISKIIEKYTIICLDEDVLKNFKSELDFNYFVSIKDINFKKYCFLSFENCSNIFGLDKVFINLLCNEKYFKCYVGTYIDIYSVFKLCVDIKSNSTGEDLLDKFIYFKDLPSIEKIRVIKSLPFGTFILYNFNCIDVFQSIKIHIDDLNYIP